MNYPLGKKLSDHLYFYIDHLNYEMEEGRISAVEMMIDMFSAFPLVRTSLMYFLVPSFVRAIIISVMLRWKLWSTSFIHLLLLWQSG